MVMFNSYHRCVEYQREPTLDCCKDNWDIFDPVTGNYNYNVPEVVIRCKGIARYNFHWNILTDFKLALQMA